MNIGLLGELEVEAQLVLHGWHPIRLDSAQMAANADLIAINRTKRIMIQVKATNGLQSNSHGDFLGFGYSTGYLRDKLPIFNAKDSPLIADVVIGVRYIQVQTRFVVMPVALAEKLCRLHCDYWFKVPTRTKTGKRSESFPVYLAFTRTPEAHGEHHDRIRKNLLAFENAWHVLDDEPDRLRNPEAWELIG